MPNIVRFIHTADLHIGAPFKGLRSQLDPNLTDRLHQATHDAWDNVVDYAINEKVDFIVIAGDIFDGADADPYDVHRFRQGLDRLKTAAIMAYMLHGNHDPHRGFYVDMELPDNTFVFPSTHVERVEFVDGDRSCALYGRSFPETVVTENYALEYKRSKSDINAIGILHTNVGGNQTVANYAPCTLTDLKSANMSYWALGHVHMVSGPLSENPYIVYSGSTQALSIRETTEHGCYLVELQDGSVDTHKLLPTSVVDFKQLEVDISGCGSEQDITAAAASAIENSTAETGVRTIVRLVLTGKLNFSGAATHTVVSEHFVGNVGFKIGSSRPSVVIDTQVTVQVAAAVDIENAVAGSRYLQMLLDTASTLSIKDLDSRTLNKLGNMELSFPELSEYIDRDAIARAATSLALEHLTKQEG